MLCDENDIGCVQLLIFITGFSHIGVDQTAVVPGTLGTSTFIAALDLDIVNTVCFIDSQNIQPHGASLQILNIVLAVCALYAQIGTLQDNLEQELGTGFVLKHLVHKVIVQQTKLSQPL